MIRGHASNGKAITIPESLSEITTGQWISVAEGGDFFEHVVGVHSSQLSEQAITVINNTMTWLGDSGIAMNPLALEIDPPEMTYNAYKSSLTAIKRSGQYKALPFVFAAYTIPQSNWNLSDANQKADDLMHTPCTIVIPGALWLLDQLGQMSLKWSRLLASEPDANQIRAGIKKFEPFEDFGAIYNLAGRDLEKAERYRNRSYNEILTTLYYLRVESEFNERYHEIKIKSK